MQQIIIMLQLQMLYCYRGIYFFLCFVCLSVCLAILRVRCVFLYCLSVCLYGLQPTQFSSFPPSVSHKGSNRVQGLFPRTDNNGRGGGKQGAGGNSITHFFFNFNQSMIAYFSYYVFQLLKDNGEFIRTVQWCQKCWNNLPNYREFQKT